MILHCTDKNGIRGKIMNVKNLSYINAVHFIFPFLDLNYKKSIILNTKYRFFVVVVLKDSNIS